MKKAHIAMIVSAVVIIVVIYLLFFRKKPAPTAVAAKSPESGFGSFIVPGVPAFPKTVVPPSGSRGKVKYVGEITNTPRPCPAGSHRVTNADGSYGCVQNAS